MLSGRFQLPVVIQEALGVGATQSSTLDLGLTDKTNVPENAGVELMMRNGDLMEDLFNRTSLNERKIQDCDMMCTQLYANLEQKNAQFAQLNFALGSINSIKAQLSKTQKLMKDVEAQLHESSLAMVIMEDTKSMIAAKRKEIDERKERDLQMKLERQKIFEEQFRNDLELFKRSGEVAVPVVKPMTMLEDLSEINLDQNDDDIEAFQDFLESSGDHSTRSQEDSET